MAQYTIIVDSFFTVLNFLIFLGLVFYYFKKKLITAIKKQLLLKRTAHIDFTNKVINAHAEQRALQSQLEQEKNLYDKLDKKLDLWQKTAQKETEQNKKEQEISLKKLKDRQQKQRDFIIQERALKLILPNALEQAKNELLSRFSSDIVDNNNGLFYNQHIIESFTQKMDTHVSKR